MYCIPESTISFSCTAVALMCPCWECEIDWTTQVHAQFYWHVCLLVRSKRHLCLHLPCYWGSLIWSLSESTSGNKHLLLTKRLLNTVVAFNWGWGHSMLLTNNYDSLGIGTKKITKTYVRNAVHFLNNSCFSDINQIHPLVQVKVYLQFCRTKFAIKRGQSKE